MQLFSGCDSVGKGMGCRFTGLNPRDDFSLTVVWRGCCQVLWLCTGKWKQDTNTLKVTSPSNQCKENDPHAHSALDQHQLSRSSSTTVASLPSLWLGITADAQLHFTSWPWESYQQPFLHSATRSLSPQAPATYSGPQNHKDHLWSNRRFWTQEIVAFPSGIKVVNSITTRTPTPQQRTQPPKRPYFVKLCDICKLTLASAGLLGLK